ncbi:NAD(P)/FAD-dependent oxidoreductase [Microterricola viridarii]|uniref:FAD-dependent oxidoreductase n=1 Tax=Microterricola viridarii TaxID=412690 RepID=A0A0X8E3V4_9MICO|nr:FAD-dependent oxidoreductase [Microterricola viridarii]AMB59067.1 FAD-dependent oxidoreductase [Microterricola viridarii]
MTAHRTVFERSAPSRAAVKQALEGAVARPFWLDDIAEGRTEYPALAGDAAADLVVVGGGYTGLWTALRAVERTPGRKVTLLESETIGWAASGRNGGFCEASLTHGEENGQSRWPDEMETLTRLGLENLDAIEETITRYSMDCDFERTGMIAVAVEPHQIEWIAGEGDDENLFADSAAMQAEIASPTFLAGHWEKEGCAMVHPAKLAAELARVCVELGVTIHENTAVQRIDDEGELIELVTNRGTVRAPQVALATNVFPSLLKRNALMTIPVYDYVLMTEPLTEAQMESIGWKRRQGLADMANQFHYYRLSADNRILFGGYDAIYHSGRKVKTEYEDRPESFEKLASHFLTTFPQLEGVKFTHRWAGAIDASTRFCAFYGVARKGRVAYAAGFTGLGVGAARFGADVMLDKLAGEKTERTELEMVRKRGMPFPPEPAASIGINLTRWSLDRADHREGKRNLLLKTLDSLGLGFDS